MGHHPSPSRLSKRDLDGRPDILNLTRLCIYEIKPAAAAAVGAAKAAMYVGIMEKAGITVSLGPSTDPGTRGQLPAPGGVYVFWSPQPGVIAYQYRRGRLVPVPVAQEQAQETRAPWRWELEPLTQLSSKLWPQPSLAQP